MVDIGPGESNNDNSNKKNKLVLAVDPGKDKCGFAVLDYDLRVLKRNIIKTVEIESYLPVVFNNYNIRDIVIGNGTFSKKIEQLLKGFSEMPISIVDEAYTTVEAEERYWKEQKRGWQRWLPFIRWKPSLPVDDYVAVILAERFIKNRFCWD